MELRGPSAIRSEGLGPGGRVVVGFDGSESARAAVVWAASEAALRDAVLRIIVCSAEPESIDVSHGGAHRRRSLTDSAESVKAVHPALKVEVIATHPDPRDALTMDLTNSDLLVVSAATPGMARTWLLGSVPRSASRRSPCPVVVVRGEPRPQIRRIMVGIDNSNAAMAAADWACREADLHGAKMLLVHAWFDTGIDRSARERHLDRVDVQCALDLAVSRCRRRSSTHVEGELVEGNPTQILIDGSAAVDLLAIGSRGRSGFKTLLFGTVALDVAERAHCPVTIAHPQAMSS
jgi:nucleotide-binding universal stress UspA family protein